MGLNPSLAATARCIDEALHYATICAAFRARIKDPEMIPLIELRAALQQAAPRLLVSLEALRGKYDAWLKFQSEVGAADGAGQLSAEQLARQVRLMQELDAERDTFLRTLHEAGAEYADL